MSFWLQISCWNSARTVTNDWLYRLIPPRMKDPTTAWRCALSAEIAADATVDDGVGFRPTWSALRHAWCMKFAKPATESGERTEAGGQFISPSPRTRTPQLLPVPPATASN